MRLLVVLDPSGAEEFVPLSRVISELGLRGRVKTSRIRAQVVVRCLLIEGVLITKHLVFIKIDGIFFLLK